MNVVAICTPPSAAWRWRIVDYSGQMIEESYTTFPSIESAVAEGVQRLHARDDRDVASTATRFSRRRN